MIYQNELAWKRTSSHSDARRFAAVSDRLLFYAGEGARWTTQYLPLGTNQLKKYRHKDKKTGWLYRADGDLTGDGTTDGESGAPWNGYDPTMIGRHWAVPKNHGYAKWLEKMLIPGYSKIKGVHARLDALDDAGLITWTKTGTPQLRRYLEGSQGEAVSDFISDIPNVNHRSKEWNGYKTQKPLKLLERLILSSTNEGDMVLDPFCGCATTLEAADKHDRHWIGIDLSPKATDLIRRRLSINIQTLYRATLVVVRSDVPHRTDLGKLPSYRTHKHRLYGTQEGRCAGCLVLFPFRNLTIDHKTRAASVAPTTSTTYNCSAGLATRPRERTIRRSWWRG